MRGPAYVPTNVFISQLICIPFRFSLLPALSSDGIIFSDIREGTYNGVAFIEYIEHLLAHMNPWPERCSVLVMDNCSIHHLDDIAPLCASRSVHNVTPESVIWLIMSHSGVRLYYLPPYSPDYNPIEEAFSYIKSVIQWNGAEFRLAVDKKNLHGVHYLLHNALATITPEKAQGWMGHSGYLCTET